jgi:predicted ATPase
MPTDFADVLLVPATRMESKAVLDVFKTTDQSPRAVEIESRTYFDLGVFGGARTFLMPPETGKEELGKCLESLTPSAVISVGVGFGANMRVQQVGEILVSTSVREFLGPEYTSSSRLISRLRSADLLWDGSQVHFGVVLAPEGPGMQRFPGPVPELAGRFSTAEDFHRICTDEGIDWIAVKGIGDFADPNASLPAATNAAKFVLHALQFAPFERAAVAPAPAIVVPPEPPSNESIYVESLHLTGFRCFDQLELPFRRESRLPGEWTCIAGINGAGKSSILQALCLVLLGPGVQQLGAEGLNRMRRQIGAERQTAEIEATLRTAESNREFRLWLTIDANGATQATSDPIGFWKDPSRILLASYGATRNLSSRAESGYENMSADLRRQITLFDPLSQLTAAEVLLRKAPTDGSFLSLFQKIVDQVFSNELQATTDATGLRFSVSKRESLEAIDLPDGYRSSAAWLADLCAIWCARSPEIAAQGNPADMQGIVLIDEIDLHLHPSLQRRLVPQLRALMPKVQWIVSTHSPLVLSNFDSNEIVALDQDKEGKIRELDRQILGFSSDQIYQWLMGTPPTGEVIEQILEKDESDDEIAELLEMSPKISEADAKARVQKLKSTIGGLTP